MKRLLGMSVTVALAASLVACAPSPALPLLPGPPVTFMPTQLTQAQKMAVQVGVRQKLRDPESARFGNMVAAQSSRGPLTVCGWVNAKNGFGGYTGDVPYFGFIKSDGIFDVPFVGGDRGQIERTMMICQSDGKYLN